MLQRIVETKRTELTRLTPRGRELRAAAESAAEGMPARGFEAALRGALGVGVIAEVKRRSPSAGWIRRDLSPVAIAQSYAAAGAAAISVLTDGEYFGGSLADLQEVRAAVTLPVLRKDFTLEPVQIWEARAAGADAVLLIARILGDAQMRELLAVAAHVGLDALVEVHTADEMERALAAGASLIGVNNRDLATFRTDLGVVLELAASVPDEHLLVAESGIRGADDVARLGEAGIDAVLVGEALMRASDVREAAAALVGHSRKPRTANSRA